jgi:hypothetical protein
MLWDLVWSLLKLNTSVIILVAMATLDRYRFYIKGDIPEDW